MEVSDQLHDTAALPPQGENPCCPLDKRLGGHQNLSGHSGGKKKISNPCRGLEPPIIQPSAIQLSYTGSYTPICSRSKYLLFSVSDIFHSLSGLMAA
jgi:hypothetical protein